MSCRNASNRLCQLLTRTAEGVLLFGATYEVDATGARTAIAESNAAGPSRSVIYAYDGAKRLVAETISRAGQAQSKRSTVSASEQGEDLLERVCDENDQ